MKSKGFIETRGLVAAIEAADAMVKQSAGKAGTASQTVSGYPNLPRY